MPFFCSLVLKRFWFYQILGALGVWYKFSFLSCDLCFHTSIIEILFFW